MKKLNQMKRYALYGLWLGAAALLAAAGVVSLLGAHTPGTAAGVMILLSGLMQAALSRLMRRNAFGDRSFFTKGVTAMAVGALTLCGAFISGEVLRCRSRDAQLSKAHQAAVSDALANVEMKSFASINELASALAAQQVRILLPDMMEDEESTAAARRAIEGIEKKNSALRRLLMVCGSVLIVAATVCAYLAQVRISGFVPVGPVYVSEYANGEITVILQQEEVIELLGRDSITVRCHVFGAPVQEGETIETGCQLAVELTNQDLLCLGINPLHSMKTRSQAVNDAYIAWAMQALFEKGAGKCATMYIREISNLQPLF